MRWGDQNGKKSEGRELNGVGPTSTWEMSDIILFGGEQRQHQPL